MFGYKKDKKYCNAYAVTTGQRCKIPALPGSNYCFRHYPKKEFLIGIVISLLLPILFHTPLMNLLSKIPILHYLDTDKPSIVYVTPDFEANTSIPPEQKTIEIAYQDLGSGISKLNSKIELYHKLETEYIPVKPVTTSNNDIDSTFILSLNEKLKYGHYLLNIDLVDKASNKLIKSYPFVVRENEYIKFSTTYCTFDKYKKKSIFSNTLKDKRIPFNKYNLFVYTVGISNQSSNALINSVNINISTQSIIFAFEEIGKYKTEKFRSYIIAEEMAKNYPRGQVFLSHRDVFIEEMGPSGYIGFAMLVGESIDPKSDKDSEVSQHIGIHGGYSCQAYGTQELKKIDKWIPMNDEGKVTKLKKLQMLLVK